MGSLIYTLNVSLDGYIETPDRSLLWTTVDEELLTWFNDRTRELAASLYGRRLYEVMAAYVRARPSSRLCRRRSTSS